MKESDSKTINNSLNNLYYDNNCNHIINKFNDRINFKLKQNLVFYSYTLALAVCMVLSKLY